MATRNGDMLPVHRLPAESRLFGDLVPQDSFLRMLHLEQRRSERSGKSFVLMLIELGATSQSPSNDPNLAKLANVLAQVTRETDVIGWYTVGSVLGAIFTEIDSAARA